MDKNNEKSSKHRLYMDDNDVYKEMLEHYANFDEDIPELTNTHNAKAELKVIKEALNEELKDIAK